MLFFLLACNPGGTVLTVPPAETNVPDLPELLLTVSEPLAYDFVGNEVTVAGNVTDPNAIVWVEGQRVQVGSAGAFRVTVPVSGLQRTIDVEAAHPDVHLRQRIPVLSGSDPLETWPGALTMRFTPTGVDHLAELVEEQIVLLDIVGQLSAALPDISVGGFSATSKGISHWPIQTTMVPGPDGLDLQISVRNLELAYEVVSGTFLGDGDVVLGFDTLVLGLTVEPSIDSTGILALEVTDTVLTLSDPTFSLGGSSSPALETLLNGAIGGVVGFLEGALDGIVSSFGRIELLGPINFDFDLLGTPIGLSVDNLATDDEGIAAVIGVDLGTGAQSTLRVPSVAEVGPRPDLAIAVHEGLFQPLLASDILDLLEQDIQLGGLFGEILGAPIQALPGGTDVPEERDGWCIALSVGEGRIVRMGDGIAPLATIVLPEVHVDVGISTPTEQCMDWLDLTLALEADLAVTSGTKLGIDLRVVDGAVDAYATTDDWEEQGVVEGLGSLISALTTLLGGSLEIDLADLLGGTGATGALAGLNLTILDSIPAENLDGEPIEGLRMITLSLWD
jgi:hypothetical protein